MKGTKASVIARHVGAHAPQEIGAVEQLLGAAPSMVIQPARSRGEEEEDGQYRDHGRVRRIPTSVTTFELKCHLVSPRAVPASASSPRQPLHRGWGRSPTLLPWARAPSQGRTTPRRTFRGLSGLRRAYQSAPPHRGLPHTNAGIVFSCTIPGHT